MASRSAPASIKREIAVVAAGQRGKLVDRHIVFAPGGAQREQALLDPLKFVRIVFGDAQRVFELGAGFVQRGQRGVDRLHRRLDQRRRLRGAALQAPHRGRERRHRRVRPDDGLMRRAQIVGDFFRLHHAGAAFGERRFLAGLRR